VILKPPRLDPAEQYLEYNGILNIRSFSLLFSLLDSKEDKKREVMSGDPWPLVIAFPPF
jgi:hypothetical protein